ncbi:hypothetical protein M427DRAFT_313931 [Gonapodya prolifera JEL478]|uniref:Uncharacterized protein n=1 Tax=Gonapodya prolifera (strain JEL478) TaxID=1344416 RepID=A0A139AX00_GONPJ|nr:hypothetical protein M427DRAFT_313931 [Gonapodya prolifera JEL478]|eukprot:KXS21229.1 hypothetical protein M427DRAFT_313931 [Gonapodya prolifera JEL478]
MSAHSQSSVSRLLTAAALVAAPLLAAAQTYNPATCTGADYPVIVNLPAGSNITIPGGVIGTSTGALGTDAVTWVVEDGGVTVNPNPAYLPNDNFWFYKFDTAECFDITQWNTIEFEYMAPAGSSFGWTMTVHQPSCSLAGPFGCFNATYYCPRGPGESFKRPLYFLIWLMFCLPRRHLVPLPERVHQVWYNRRVLAEAFPSSVRLPYQHRRQRHGLLPH